VKPALSWALAGGALLAAYFTVIGGLIEQWNADADMGHAFAVPFVIAWVVWTERARWRAGLGPGSAWGYALLAAGAALQLAGAVGVGLFAGALGLYISSMGAVAALGGFTLLRALVFPFVLALFMLPKLAFVYNQVTLPLQLMASRLAAALLTTAGLGVLRHGNVLEVHGVSVAVEEACSGIRYLLPLGFVSLVYGYLAGGARWMRAALLVATIPLAIAANATRVAAVAAVPAWLAETPHLLLGWVIFVLSLGVLAGLQALLGRLRRA
jgi:exosortase